MLLSCSYFPWCLWQRHDSEHAPSTALLWIVAFIWLFTIFPIHGGSPSTSVYEVEYWIKLEQSTLRHKLLRWRETHIKHKLIYHYQCAAQNAALAFLSLGDTGLDHLRKRMFIQMSWNGCHIITISSSRNCSPRFQAKVYLKVLSNSNVLNL